MKTLMALGIGFFIGQYYTRKKYTQQEQHRTAYLEGKMDTSSGNIHKD